MVFVLFSHAQAQRFLGVCYEQGEGVAKDPAKSIEWYTKAAKQGDADAQLKLGPNGQNVKVEADAEQFTKDAEAGDIDAQRNLGVCYQYGTGVDKNVAKAIEWFTKAAEGDITAALYLG